ncbi:MAG: alpha/beta fold hydrolase [Bacteroidota bacterium]
MIPNPILHGGSSKEIGEMGASLIPGSTLTFIDGAGHMLQMEKPDAFNSFIIDRAR